MFENNLICFFFLLIFQQGAPAPGPTIASAPLPPSIQKTPDRKSVGSPGVQGSPRKVSISGFFQQKYWIYPLISSDFWICLVETWSKSVFLSFLAYSKTTRPPKLSSRKYMPKTPNNLLRLVWICFTCPCF